MNLHPVTLLFILILAAFFYSQGQFFFLFATLAIGFLLLLSSLTSPSSSGHGDVHSVYPEKMTIDVRGPEEPLTGGEKDFAERVGGTVDFTGNLLGAIFGGKGNKKEEKSGGHH